MHVNLFFDGLPIGELLTFKTGPPCINEFFLEFFLIDLVCTVAS